MTRYYVDYENVNMNGISDCEILEPGDKINIFYSAINEKISLTLLERFLEKDVRLGAYGVDVGTKNALDFQLTTQLGYDINRDPECNFVIISRDTGFDVVVLYWKKRGVRISRRQSIQSDNAQTVSVQTVKKNAKGIIVATKSEMLKYISEDEYSEQLLQVFNSYKTKTAINNGFAKILQSSKKTGVLYNKLKPLFVTKEKT